VENQRLTWGWTTDKEEATRGEKKKSAVKKTNAWARNETQVEGTPDLREKKTKPIKKIC